MELDFEKDSTIKVLFRGSSDVPSFDVLFRGSSDIPYNSLWPVGSSKIVEITVVTSLAEIGEVRAEPNGNLIVPSLAIDSAGEERNF